MSAPVAAHHVPAAAAIVTEIRTRIALEKALAEQREFERVLATTRAVIERQRGPEPVAVLPNRERQRPANRQEARDARRARRRRGKGWTR